MIEIASEILEKDKNLIYSHSRFKEDLDADDQRLAELCLRIELEFDMEIPDEDAERLLSVRDVAEFINRAQER
ncbi:acyl carrier protein [Streptomyces klenkii]